MTDYRIFIRSLGGPEVLEREPIDPSPPAAGEVRVRHTAIGLNFIDTYYRKGLYPMELPGSPGVEGAGVVEAIGEGVTGFRSGDRVAYVSKMPGSYATVRNLPAAELAILPDTISDEIGAAVMVKGLTTWALAEPCSRLKAGQTALVHAAAGGVGSLLVQWLKAIGVTVIAHAGSAEKARRATELGADHALDLPFDSLAQAVRDLTGGRGVDAVFDGVGAASWQATLASTARRGLVASFGNASGPVPPFTVRELTLAGSLFVTRPSLYDYMADPAERRAGAERLFALIAEGKLRIEINHRFALTDAASAHRALEGRQTTGSTILIP